MTGDGFAVTVEAVAPAVTGAGMRAAATALDGLVTALEQAPATPLHAVGSWNGRAGAGAGGVE